MGRPKQKQGLCKYQDSKTTGTIFIKALLLSLILHVCLSKIFIITFPAQPTALRPSFIFWGSIIPPKDFVQLSYNREIPEKKILAESSILLAEPQQGLQHYLFITKPFFSNLVIPDKKQQYKSSFNASHATLEKQTDPLETLGIAPNAPPRSPLRFHPND